MPVRVVCPLCGAGCTLPDRVLGEKVACATCGFRHRLTPDAQARQAGQPKGVTPPPVVEQPVNRRLPWTNMIAISSAIALVVMGLTWVFLRDVIWPPRSISVRRGVAQQAPAGPGGPAQGESRAESFHFRQSGPGDGGNAQGAAAWPNFGFFGGRKDEPQPAAEEPADAARSDDPPAKPGGEPAPRRELSVADIVAKCEPSVCVVESGRGTGTGFVVARQLLVTNAHVVGDANNLRVRFPSAAKKDQGPLDAEVIHLDRMRDLAFLRVKTPLPPLALADNYQLRKGEDVLVIGSPGGLPGMLLENAVSRGVMSTRLTINGNEFYQLNIAINPGNSGGPVFDMRGRVIGVATAKIAHKEGVGLCIPIEDLRPAVALARRQTNSPGGRNAAARVVLEPRPPESRAPAPATRVKLDADAVAQARKEVGKLFAGEIEKAKTAAARATLAERLQSFAVDAEGDPPGQFSLYDEARNQAALAGKLQLALEILESMRNAFEWPELDEGNLDQATIDELAHHVVDWSEQIELAKAALSLVDEALERDDFAAARRLLSLANRRRDPRKTIDELINTCTERVSALEQQFNEVKPHLEALKRAPDHAESNLAVGTYRCLWKDDWEHGLPLLAKGGTDPLARLARADAAGTDDPTEQAGIGDAWWDVAEKLKNPPRASVMRRAVEWYERCVDRLTGLAKVRTSKRLDEARGSEETASKTAVVQSVSRKGRSGLVAEYFQGANFDSRLAWRIDPAINFDWGDGGPGPDMPADSFGVRWTGYLQVPKRGHYVLKIRSDNGARWTLDNRVLYDSLSPNGQHEHEIPVDLGTDPMPMQLDYLEGIFTAWCQLSWRPPGKSEFEPIPARYFSHKREQEPRDAR